MLVVPLNLLNYLIVFCISLIPALESRVAIPYGVGIGIRAEEVLFLSLVGNSIAVPLAMFLVSRLDKFLLMKRGFIPDMYRNVSFRAAEKVSGKMEKWGYLGLLAFVAIPLPGSGVWTGALAAQVLRLKKPKVALMLFGGQLLAALSVFLMVKGAVQFFT